MSVAEYLSHLGGEPRGQWLAAANRYLPPLVCAILVLTIAYKLAEITWALLPQAVYDGTQPEVSPATATATRDADVSTNFQALRDSHLFDVAAEEPVVAPPTTIVDAPNTTLNLRLSGTVLAEHNGGESEATITSGNQPEKLYRIGATIEGASGATLHQVYRDRVILNRNGRLETLRRPEPTAAARTSAPLGRPSLPVASATAPLRQVISENATRLTDVVRFAPHVEGGQVVGFRVTPGRDADTFASLGLEPGDVVTDINGLTLDDPARGLQAFEALGESTMANVTILRDGAPQVVVIDTNQLNAVSEDRQ